MSEVVERRPLGQFCLPGRPVPHLAGRVPPERRAVAAREDQIRRAPPISGEVFGHHRAHDIGQGDGAESSLALRWTELGHARIGPEQPAVDPDLTVEEVDPVDAESEAPTLAEAGAGGEQTRAL